MRGQEFCTESKAEKHMAIKDNEKKGEINPVHAPDFIRAIVSADIKDNKHGGRIATRFPPEPNGYLHIGHAKAFSLNFSIAEEFGGQCNLRFEDTDPRDEDIEYVKAIKRDIRWMGFDWGNREFFVSDYFERLYQYAVKLIEKGKAYVDSLSAEEIRDFRGTLTEPGKDSPFRNRSIEENLNLFEGMRAGHFKDGEHVLRARIDMASPNLLLRDPTLYRIRHQVHFRAGDSWCIYPMYDFVECLADAIEGVTHSLCDTGFENNRVLYDWILRELEIEDPPRQYEFARLNLSYTILSKRYLKVLVEDGHVSGWDDPRMPTLSGMRRRGYTPVAIRRFVREIGIAKRENLVDIALFEHIVRTELNEKAQRVMGVLRPLKVIVVNYPKGQVEHLEAVNNPEDESAGTRKVPFSRVIYIERDDFREDPPKRFHRLAPGREVRLRYGYYITCVEVVKDDRTGEVSELRCTYDPETRGGSSPDGRKVRGTIHWVSAPHALKAEVRLYDRLFAVEDPKGSNFKDQLNPHSLEVLGECRVEPSLAGAAMENPYQFERLGYFCLDSLDSSPGKLVFNRTVALRDSWKKIERAQGRPGH